MPPISVITTSTSSLAELADDRLDLVGDVRNDLHGLAEELALPLLVDHRQVDLAGGVVRVAGERAVGEALVVAQVEVGFAAVVQHVDFAVLVGAHRAGVDVDVRIELLHPHAQAAALEQHADRRAGEALAQGADDAAGDEDVFGHILILPSWYSASRMEPRLFPVAKCEPHGQFTDTKPVVGSVKRRLAA